MIRLLLFAALLALAGCGVYSFTGSSTAASTATVMLFENKAARINPSLSQDFTERLQNKLRVDTRLRVVKDTGELVFSGFITDYSFAPAAVSSDTKASLTRLTITLDFRFQNRLDSAKSFQRSISNYADFEASLSIPAVEADISSQVIEKLVQDIFNQTVTDW